MMETKRKVRKSKRTKGFKFLRLEKEKGLSAVVKCKKKGGKFIEGKCYLADVAPEKKKFKKGSSVKDPISKR